MVYSSSRTAVVVRWVGQGSVLLLALVALLHLASRLPVSADAVAAFTQRPGVAAAVETILYLATAGLMLAGTAAVALSARPRGARGRARRLARRAATAKVRAWRPGDRSE